MSKLVLTGEDRLQMQGYFRGNPDHIYVFDLMEDALDFVRGVLEDGRYSSTEIADNRGGTSLIYVGISK